MPLRWLNDGKRDANGNYTLVIETESGARVSTFTAQTKKELAEKVAQSQEQANITISKRRNLCPTVG